MMSEKEFLKEQAKRDQDISLVADTLAGVCYRLYTRCLEEGFTESQAMQLAEAYITNFKG
jgi:hypothetical protein